MRFQGVKFDDILINIGEFGRYQVRIYNLICLFQFITPWHVLVLVFLAGESNHWCKTPEWDSVDCGSNGLNTSWDCAIAKRDVGVPYFSNYSTENDADYAQCKRYNITGVEFNPNLDLREYDTIPCDAGWEYDASQSKSTTINEDFNLVCGSPHLVSISQSIYFVGESVGALLMGSLSDRFGRHRCLFFCLSGLVVSGVATAFSTGIWMFTFLRAIVATTNIGVLVISFVLANEFIGPSKRNWAGNLIWVYFGFGYVSLALAAYFLQNWRHLQLFISITPAVLFLLYFVLPESARWLLAKGRENEASKIINKIAKVNKAQMTEFCEEKNPVKKEPEKVKEQGFIDLMRRPRLRWYTLNLMLNMTVNNMVYYGLSLSTNTLGVNIYLAFAIAGAVEIPACFSVIYPIERWGRRPVYIIYMVASGIACLATTLIQPGAGRAAVAMIGKFSITASYCVVYLHACEIFPTPVRNSALGMCSLWSHVANIVGPMILLSANVWRPFPFVIFGLMSLIAAVLAIFLPETRGKKAPETMEEGENIGWKGNPRCVHQKSSTKSPDVKYHIANGQEGVQV